MARGAHPGERHHLAKMTDAKVRKARLRYEQGGISHLDLAIEYDLSVKTMGDILRYKTWKHVGMDPMARNITVESDSGWRTVLIFKEEESGELRYFYEGIYDKPGTAKGRVSWWRNAQTRIIHDGPDWNKTNKRRARFYDGWIEKATITWEKVKD